MASHASTGSGRVCAQFGKSALGGTAGGRAGILVAKLQWDSDCLKRVLGLEDAATAMSAFSARVLC